MLTLAIDTTTLRGRVVVLAISVLSRGTAIPVVWAVLPHRGKGLWQPEWARPSRMAPPEWPRVGDRLILEVNSTDQAVRLHENLYGVRDGVAMG